MAIQNGHSAVQKTTADGHLQAAALSPDDLTALSKAASKAMLRTGVYLGDSSNKTARIKALTAVKELVIELQTGDDAYFSRFEQQTSNHVLRFMMSIGVPEAIPTDGDISAADLASAVRSEITLIVRMMRMLCATGVFEETSQDCYAHTKRSIDLLDPGHAMFFEIMMDDMINGTGARYAEYFASHALAAPRDTKFNPYAWAWNMDGSDWNEVMSRNPATRHKLTIGMSGRLQSVAATGIYPFGAELVERSERVLAQDGVLIVDVGGAMGNTMKEIREVYPELQGRMVVQDTAKVIKSIPEHYLPAAIEASVHDFWLPQPVKAAEVYYIR